MRTAFRERADLPHVAPVVLGGGVRMFGAASPSVKLEPADVTSSPAVTHLRYRVGPA